MHGVHLGSEDLDVTGATARRSRPLLLAVAPVLLATGVLVAERPALTSDRGFRVVSPADGSRVHGSMTLAWSSADAAT